jgi:hypothetical protein
MSRPKGSKNKPRPHLDNVQHIPCAKPELVQHIGRFIRYFDKGWRFSKLLAIKDNIALLEHPVSGKHKLSLKDVEPNPWAK